MIFAQAAWPAKAAELSCHTMKEKNTVFKITGVKPSADFCIQQLIMKNRRLIRLSASGFFADKRQNCSDFAMKV